MKFLKSIFVSLLLISLSFPLLAATGVATNWQIGFQEAASPIMRDIDSFYTFMLYLMYGIAGFVFLILAYITWRFSAKRNPKPSKTRHNTLLEIIWTAVPVLILVMMAIPSFKLLYKMDTDHPMDMTLKITGYQWYWGYEYPDHDGIEFLSYIIPDDEIKEGQYRLLEVDNRVILPVGKKIRLIITAGDVLHSWSVPAFGIKTDAVPGRLNEAWVEIEKEGVYYGQCSEICGIGHGFMPIAIEAVSEEKFNQWVKDAKKKFASHNQLKLASLN